MLAVELYAIISSEKTVLEFLQKNKLLPQNNETNLYHKCHGETKMYMRKRNWLRVKFERSALYNVYYVYYVSQKDVRHINQFDQQMDFFHILILMHDAILISVWAKY